MIWRRYRFTVVSAVVISAILGLLCGIVVYLSGNADNRAQAGWGGLLYWIALGGALGAGSGLTECVGGLTAIALRDRRLARARARARTSRIAIPVAGASIGAALPWAVLSVAAAVTGGAGYVYPFIGIAVAVAVVSAVLACPMLGRAERRQHNGTVASRFDA